MGMYFRNFKNTDDVDKIAGWIYETDEIEFNYLFSNDEIRAKTALGRLIRSDHINPYHRNFIMVVADDRTDEIMGVAIAYKGSQVSLKEKYRALIKTECTDNISIAGYFMIGELFTLAIDDEDYYLGNLYVDEKYRHMHLGSKLVNKVKENAKLLNCNNITLDVVYNKPYLLKFYEKLDFIEDGMNYHKILSKEYGCYAMKHPLK